MQRDTLTLSEPELGIDTAIPVNIPLDLRPECLKINGKNPGNRRNFHSRYSVEACGVKRREIESTEIHNR